MTRERGVQSAARPSAPGCQKNRLIRLTEPLLLWMQAAAPAGGGQFSQPAAQVNKPVDDQAARTACGLRLLAQGDDAAGPDHTSVFMMLQFAR